MSAITSTSTVNELIKKVYSKITCGYDVAMNNIKPLYEIRPTKFNFEEIAAIKSLPAAQKMIEGGSVFNAGFESIGTKRLQVYDYSIAINVTYQILRDNLYPSMAPKFGKNLLASQVETANRVAASILNFATSTTNVGVDGQPLASQTHPTDAGFNSNLYTSSSAITESLIETLVLLALNITDEAAKTLTQLYAKSLHVNQSQIFDARVVLDSLTRVGTASASALEINPANGVIIEGFTMNKYLVNDLVIVRTNLDGLLMLEREKLRIFQLGNPENLTVKVTSLLSYAMNFTNFMTAMVAYSGS